MASVADSEEDVDWYPRLLRGKKNDSCEFHYLLGLYQNPITGRDVRFDQMSEMTPPPPHPTKICTWIPSDRNILWVVVQVFLQLFKHPLDDKLLKLCQHVHAR